MEGYTLNCLKQVLLHNLLNSSIDSHFFYCGYLYVYHKKFSRFYDFEIKYNTQKLNIKELEEYIKSIYTKHHLEKMQATYCLSKAKRIESAEVKKLVVTNPYTKGLKHLMLAFVEDSEKEKIALFEKAINYLAHIKYYHIEAIYFYSKYLKSIQHSDYQSWFDKGFEMADRFYYRYLKHCFLDLQNDTDTLYIEENYPIPLDKSEVDAFIKKYNGENEVETDIHKEIITYIPPKIKTVNLVYVEGITDKMILEKAIEFFSRDKSIIKVETGKETRGAGVNWVKDNSLSWVYDTNKKEKLFILLDNDTDGNAVKKELQETPKFKSKETEKQVKIKLLDSPSHIINFYKKGVFKLEDYDFSIEQMFALAYWNDAKEKNWLENKEDIHKLNLRLGADETPKSHIINKGLSEAELIYVFHKINPDKKIAFAEYLCKQNKEAFCEFERLVKDIDDFFDEK